MGGGGDFSKVNLGGSETMHEALGNKNKIPEADAPLENRVT